MSLLVDTDWIIDALAGVPSAVEPLEEHAGSGLAVSIISFGELYEGVHDSPNPGVHIESLHRFLAGFSIIGLDDATMRVFAESRYRLRKQGKLIPDFDLLIAATALHHDLTLLTRNRRHFERIPDLRLYHTTFGS